MESITGGGGYIPMPSTAVATNTVSHQLQGGDRGDAIEGGNRTWVGSFQCYLNADDNNWYVWLPPGGTWLLFGLTVQLTVGNQYSSHSHDFYVGTKVISGGTQIGNYNGEGGGIPWNSYLKHTTVVGLGWRIK